MTSFSNICACAFSRQDEEHTKAFKAAQLDSSCNSWTQYQSYCSKFSPPPPFFLSLSMQQYFCSMGWQRCHFCATNFYRDTCIHSLTRSFIRVPWMGGGGPGSFCFSGISTVTGGFRNFILWIAVTPILQKPVKNNTQSCTWSINFPYPQQKGALRFILLHLFFLTKLSTFLTPVYVL